MEIDTEVSMQRGVLDQAHLERIMTCQLPGVSTRTHNPFHYKHTKFKLKLIYA